MFKVAVQVTCMVLLASVFYDVLSCNHLYSTQTYKYAKQVGSSKYGKLLLKKLKKAKRKYLKSLAWPTCTIPADNGETLNQLEPYVYFVDWPMNLKNSAISFMHYVLTYFDKNISSFQYLTSLSFDDLMKIAKDGVSVVFQQMQKCAAIPVEYMTKIDSWV